jgi:hypothetical protein
MIAALVDEMRATDAAHAVIFASALAPEATIDDVAVAVALVIAVSR